MNNHKEVYKKYIQSPKGKAAIQRYKDENADKIKEYQREYRKSHPEKFKYNRESYLRTAPNKREYERNLTQQFKDKFFEMYGDVCACCGESIRDFLTIEHKQGQRKNGYPETGLRAYRVATHEYRPDLYEVLCWNCNCTKGKLGYCPHKGKLE